MIEGFIPYNELMQKLELEELKREKEISDRREDAKKRLRLNL